MSSSHTEHHHHGGESVPTLPSSHPFRQRYTLADVWQAARTHTNFDYVFWLNICLDILYEFIIRLFGKVLVVMAVLLITGLGFGGLCIVLPELTPVYSLLYVLQCGVGLFILYSIYFNYYMASSTPPGSPKDFLDSQGQLHNSPKPSNPAYSYQQCKKCYYPKPLRCHHCSICNSCVMRMDHHCPWLSNCVGLRNYRFFVSFLFWVTIGTSYLTMASFPLITRPGSLLFPRENTLSWVDVLKLFRPSKAVDGGDVTKTTAASVATSHFTVPSIYQKWKEELIDHQQHVAVTDKAQQRKLLEENTGIALLNIGRDHGEESPSTRTRLRGHMTDQKAAMRKEAIERLHRRHEYFHLPHTVPKWYTVYLHLPNEPVTHFMIFTISIGVMIGVGFLLGFHIYLISTGYTTIEIFSLPMTSDGNTPPPNPFNKGTLKNFQILFGTDKWYIALLPRLHAPISAEELRYFPIAGNPSLNHSHQSNGEQQSTGSSSSPTPPSITNRTSHSYHHSGEEAV